MRTRELAISLALAAGFKASAAEHRLSTADFTTVSQCAVCHQEIYGQWQTSMHSKAATDTLFQQLLPQAASDLGERGIGFCLTCHTPVATVSKEVGIYKPVSLPLKLSSVAMEGVTCDFCHTISGNEHSVTTSAPAPTSIHERERQRSNTVHTRMPAPRII